MSRNRLPEPWGRWIDRSRPLRFEFEGRAYEGLLGDTLASALMANGVDLISRSFKYHRPRGVVSLRGLDANAYVQVGPTPNERADVLRLTDGLEAFGQNYTGSLQRDSDRQLERLGVFMPVGFYYKTFFRPQGVWNRWERLIRKKAGLGRIDPTTPHGRFDKRHLFADVAVIGGGPAGIAAAVAAARHHDEVVLVEMEPAIGGSLLYDRDAVPVPELPANVTVLTDTTATGLFADRWLALVQGNRLLKLRARRVVLATGSIEQPMVFRNNDLPGVLLGSAAQRAIRLWGIRPGREAVVVTANDAGYAAALDLVDAGVRVRGVADLRARAPEERWRALARARGLAIDDGTTVVEAFPGRAGVRLEGVALDRVTGEGTTAGQPVRLGCDLLVTSVGYAPLGQLACHAGARLAYDEALATFRVEGVPDGVRLAGSVNQVWSPDAVRADGEAAGADRAFDPPAEAVSHPWPIFPHPDGKDFVDLDEDQTVKDLVNAVADGFDHVELAKRYSTTGMGPSQGRLSSVNALRIVQKANGRGLAGTHVTTQRPPFLPESFGHLAGRHREPVRLTAVHRRHVEAGAVLMPAASWLRPAFYGAAPGREAAIGREVRAVREGVGLIDVGTLGKLEIRGPDAAAFLERVYVGRYAKQPVGRSRYVLACDHTGAIVDDGVACRFAEDRFFVTATTSGVDALYRAMLRWNAEWRLDVDVANVTSAYAAFNLAGPHSRAVLRALEPDLDVSADAFRYLDVREAKLGDIPVRLLRVGFVGELGYEIHVPAAYGSALWDRIVAAGRGHDLHLFGVEAQRVLRLEKGHIIIGQDTDGLTFPHEAGLDGLIGKAKPFFVGQRAIEVQARNGLTRRLVGFRLPLDSPVPPECCLVLKGKTIAGRVTSAARSAACAAIVGMAYVDPADAAPGSRLEVKLEDGSRLWPEVVPTPFYDPDSARQAL